MGLKDIFKGIFKPTSEFREPTHCTSVAREMNSAMENIEGYSIRYHYEDVSVCVWNGNIPEGTEVGNRIVFIQEKDNDYDPNAVLLLLVPQKRKLGYLYGGRLQQMVNDYLNRGDKVTARISQINNNSVDLVCIDMVFYNKVNKKKK